MKRTIILTIISLMSMVSIYGNENVDINISTKLITPLTISKSSETLTGQALGGQSGDYNLTPITVTFSGSSNSEILFTADQYVDLINGSDTIRMTTGLIGGVVTSNGTSIQSELILSTSGSADVDLDGGLTLDGSEVAGSYVGTLNIQVDYN